jgi:sulfur-carrier protein adenylyltransferase/sulfurtransferase
MVFQGEVPEMTVTELKKKLDAGEEVILLDVREPHELKICSLNNTFHIPLGDLADRLEEMDRHKAQDIVVYCRSGRRSEMAASFMYDSGFQSVYNLKGGVLAWSDEIDSSFQKY